MTHIALPQHKNPCPGGHEIYNLRSPSLVIITIHLFCLKHAPEQRRRFFKKKINFTLFTPKLPPLCHEIYNFLSPYPTDATYQIWLRLAQQFLRRCSRTTDDDGRKLIAIGHLSTQVTLKIKSRLLFVSIILFCSRDTQFHSVQQNL